MEWIGVPIGLLLGWIVIQIFKPKKDDFEKQLEKDIKAFRKKHPQDCKRGYHVPVGMTDESGNIEEVFCQNCAIEMTRKDYDDFFLDPEMASIQERLKIMFPGSR